MGGRPTDNAEAKKQLLEELASLPAFQRRGPRVANNRWISWLQGAQWANENWHARLLICIYCGLQTGVYKSLDETPLFGEYEKRKQDQQPEESDEEGEERDREAAAGVVAFSEHAGAAASSGAAPD